ncbi:MAG: MBL fold metallo-hydrolase [Solirubrobacterales bacterium]
MNAAARTELAGLQEVVPGLHASPPEALPFAPSLHVRSFLLERKRGNVLLYAVPELEASAEAIEALGGISRWYLGHWHEATFASDWVRAPLFVHEAERASVVDSHPVRATFSRRHHLDEDLEVIPIPGHTAGSTAYLWDSGEHRLLFTADTIYLDGGEWSAAVLGSSDRNDYADSLDLIRGLDFDVLVPWAATGGDPLYAHTDANDARRRIDTILERVRSGEDH